MPELSTVLAGLEPIRELSAGRIEELAGLCQTASFPIASRPLTTPEERDRLVYLIRGELKMDMPDGGMSLLVGGCDQANWPVGVKTPWPVTSRAITDIQMLHIDRNALDIMLTWDQLSGALDGSWSKGPDDVTLWRSMSGAFSVDALTKGAFSRLPPAHIHELLCRFDRIKVKAGQVLIREGEDGDYYFLIESGRCEVKRRVGGVDVLVAELRAGEAFGEEALVAGVKRNATVEMKSDGVLLRLAKPDFEELLKAPLLHRLTRAEADRRVAGGDALWLDVRYPAEFAQDGLANAINIPLNEIRSAYGLLDGRREYIVYCQSGRRSSAAAFLLAQHGFSACWLEGGLAACLESSS